MAREMIPDRTKCRYCGTELTYDEKRKCSVCLVCNPPSKVAAPEPVKTKYIDVKMTEKRVREIVIDELENWHIRKPPVTKSEVKELTNDESAPLPDSSKPNWRTQAKELGIELFHRTKEDVLVEIEARLVSKTEGFDNG
jgi:hypothetical protein